MQPVLEFSADAANLASVFLARKNSIHTWWASILACVLFAILSFKVKLYADTTLQLFFIVMSVYGWKNWQKIINNKPLPITRVTSMTLLTYIILSLGIITAYGMLLHSLTDASFPFIDSIILVISILAQFLLITRKLENWLFWIIVNVIAVPVYFTKGLFLTSFLYAVFLVNAIYGFKKWKTALSHP
ncbi:MAG TPA: nicotinamide riboside transporter PnuC [Gammaproteobacteria bacterium]|nr:nicotinamide riboside transporter PnuC [Gammaproteobacteria bacterium]